MNRYEKSVEPICCPSHVLRLLALPTLVERATQKPTPIVYIPHPPLYLILLLGIWKGTANIHP